MRQYQYQVSINFSTPSSHEIHRKLFPYHRGDWDIFHDLIHDIPLD